jgi:threonine dehydratase
MEYFDTDMIHAAKENLRSHVLKTPLVHSQTLSRLCGCRLYLKMECWQTCGCFKIRGVTNFLVMREKEVHERGVVAASSGNHALALAYTASKMGVKNVKIFLPETADPAKVEKIRLYNVEPVCEGENFFAAFDSAQTYARRTGACYVHSHADPLVIAGQGTIGLEILEDLPKVDSIVVPVGGGGLIAGIAAAAKTTAADVKIYGAEPEASPGAFLSLQRGKPCERIDLKPSLADGLSGGFSPLPFRIAATRIERVVLAAEKEIVAAMGVFFSAEQLVIEGAASVGLAVLLSQKLDLSGQNVVLVVTGRNIDAQLFLSIISNKGNSKR